MSNQLACLRGCGLVEAIPDGRRTWYRLADSHLVPTLNDLLEVVLYCRTGLPQRMGMHLLMPATTLDARRSVLRRRVRLIVGVTISYNLIEAIVAIRAGAVASSVALVGFGLDSTIEVLSAAAVAWQFTRRDPERWEKGTLRFIAVAFFALAAYIA